MTNNLPTTIVDCHHHFLHPELHFHATLKEAGVPQYTAEQYGKDCGNLPITKTVHVEALADDGTAEAGHVEAIAECGGCKVAAIVANCDLSRADAATLLDQIVAASPRVRGVRYILDYDGPFDGGMNPTHVACKNHDTDYLRDPVAAPDFEKGFALLERRGLSFDLQCCPAQMGAAEALFRRYPGVQVVINHLGKPSKLRGDGSAQDEAKISSWRSAMTRLAALPQELLVRDLVLEAIAMFGVKRCMFNSNWHIDGSISNSDSGGVASDKDLTMKSLFQKFHSWVAHLDEEDREWLFAKSAEKFYRI
eukprot:scaffold2113_cov63-Attheya_sp.AAC.12